MTRVKICGLHRQEDIDVCLEMGVDYLGFIFAPQSPRFISCDALAALDTGNALRVGVFVDSPLEEVLRVVERARLDRVQLHGMETPEMAAQIGSQRVIKVFWPERTQGDSLLKEMRRYVGAADFFLLDAGKSGGGHGVPLHLEELKSVSIGVPLFIAGGIGEDNVGDVVREMRPYAVDLNSALECAPGIKDAEKIRRAVRAVARACR